MRTADWYRLLACIAVSIVATALLVHKMDWQVAVVLFGCCLAIMFSERTLDPKGDES